MCLIGLTLSLASNFVQAQVQKGDQPPTMEKQKFGPEVARLSFLTGNFVVELMTYDSPMGKGGPGTGHNSAYWVMDSTFVMMDHEDESLAGKYKGHGMFTYDRQENLYKCWWFDNMGGGTLYTGGFDGDTLVLSTDMKTPQGSAKMKLMWHPAGQQVKFRIMSDMGKGFAMLLESTSTRSRRGLKVRAIK